MIKWIKRFIKRWLAEKEHEKVCKANNHFCPERTITAEQFREAVEKGKPLFSVDDNFTIRKFTPYRFTIEVWNKLCGGKYTRDVIMDNGKREYSPKDVFATEEEAKEEAKRLLTERLAELNRKEGKE